jgi:hypothetical protein
MRLLSGLTSIGFLGLVSAESQAALTIFDAKIVDGKLYQLADWLTLGRLNEAADAADGAWVCG